MDIVRFTPVSSTEEYRCNGRGVSATPVSSAAPIASPAASPIFDASSASRESDTIGATACAGDTDEERASRRMFFGVSATIFAISTTLTIVGCTSMSSMGGMPMPGGWTMSMTWMRMPGQSWLGAAASFVGMWIVMMKAMMLPSLTPMLWRYRRAVLAGEKVTNAIAYGGRARIGGLLVLVGTAYFFVWLLYGVAIFVSGVTLAALEMRVPSLARAVPMVSAYVVIAAGVVQLTRWKAHHLACCRAAPGQGHSLGADARTAWRHGLRLGVHCSYCTAGLTAVMLVMGVMDLRAMAVVSLAMTIERLAPNGQRTARIIGLSLLAVGVWMIAQAV